MEFVNGHLKIKVKRAQFHLLFNLHFAINYSQSTSFWAITTYLKILIQSTLLEGTLGKR